LRKSPWYILMSSKNMLWIEKTIFGEPPPLKNKPPNKNFGGLAVC